MVEVWEVLGVLEGSYYNAVCVLTTRYAFAVQHFNVHCSCRKHDIGETGLKSP